VDLREYLRVLRAGWALILACIVGMVALASAATALSTPTYASSARLFVSTPEQDSSLAYQGSLFSAARIASYAELVTSRQVSRTVIDELNLDLAPPTLEGMVTASVMPETLILQVTVTDDDPRQAQRIAQSVAENVTELVAELETPPGQDQAPIKATVVDDAQLPMAPISPEPQRNLAIGVALGLLLGVGAAVLREMLDVTVKTPSDVVDTVGLPVLGSIGYSPDAAKDPLIIALDASSPHVEAFRVLRTNMQFIDVDRESRVFTVTSSVPGEAKSSTATNLAIVLAQAGQKVLLLEGDLRRPSIHLKSELEQSVGLTTVLLGRISLKEAVQSSGVVNLHVLTSGAIPPNPSELLQSHAMADAIAEARETYDVVIIDAPPLLPVTDAALLAAQSDGALVVIRHGKTTKDQLQQAVERITAAGGRPVGAVINLVPRRHRADGYSTYAYGGPHTRPSTRPSTAVRAEQHDQKVREPDASETEQPITGPSPKLDSPRQWTVNGSGTGWPEPPDHPASVSQRP
jgi:capsular exopolysaccharide synthesis family protein